MKKVLTLLLLFSFMTPVFAKSTFTLKSGDVSVLTSSGEASVTFDYSKAELEGKDISLEDYFDQESYKKVEKWERGQDMAHKDFIKHFNKKSPGLKLVTDSKSAQYDVVIQIRIINLGSSAKSWVPSAFKAGATDGGITLYGRFIVKDKKGKELCSLRFTNVQGMAAPNIESRLLFAYQQLNADFQKFMKKASSVDSSSDDDDE